MIIKTCTYARAGFLGNPSDGYFGKTISISVRNFGATISLYESPELHIEPHEKDLNIYKNVDHLVKSVDLIGYYGGPRLIKAGIKKFVEFCRNNNIKISKKNFSIRYHSTIPRQVGLAGSSAIITATMHALMQFYNVNIPLEMLPSLVLSAEVDELGINAGLQDRVIQVYEGCVYMNFDKKIMQATKHGTYEHLDPHLLPNLYIAYNTDLGKVSGKVLDKVRIHYEEGDPFFIETLNKIAQIAKLGKRAILNKNTKKLHKLMNQNFDLRCKIMNISEIDMEMVKRARNCGASAKFTGSGGSIIGIYYNNQMFNQLVKELKKMRALVIKPVII